MKMQRIRGDYDKDTTLSHAKDEKAGRIVRGAITLVGNFKRMSIEAATLRVTYWPDRTQPELCAELTVQEAR